MHSRNQALHMVLLAEKRNMGIDLQFARELFGRSAIGPVSRHIKDGIHVLANFLKCANAVQHPLHRPKVRNMQNSFVAGPL